MFQLVGRLFGLTNDGITRNQAPNHHVASCVALRLGNDVARSFSFSIVCFSFARINLSLQRRRSHSSYARLTLRDTMQSEIPTNFSVHGGELGFEDETIYISV